MPWRKTGRRSGSGTSPIPCARSRSPPSASGCGCDWLYGDQIGWTTHLVVLSEKRDPDFTAERLAQGRRLLHERYGMPMAWTPRTGARGVDPRLPRGRRRAPARARPRRRAAAAAAGPELRRASRSMTRETIARAATEAGLDPGRARRLGRRGRRSRPRCARTCAPPARRRPPPARRTTSSAGPPRSAATRARATSSSARRRRPRTGRRRAASTCRGSGPSRRTRRRSPTSRPS